MANFRTSNRIKALCFLLCVSLAVAAYVVANVLASKHFFRKAFGTTPGLVLGEESRNILAQLKSDVEIFVLLEKTEAYADDMFELIKRDVRHLMNEYVQSATGHRIKIDVIDVSEYPKRHADLCGRFGVLPLNCVIIATNGAVRVLAVDELYEVKRGKAVAFRGERVITSAIGKLIDDKPSIIYFIHGHGEYELGDVSRSRGLSSMENFAKQKNCEMRSINLCDTKCIPSDADLVVIVGARSKFLGFEEEILRDFIDNGQGKLVVALDGIFDIGLRDFFEDYGIAVGEGLLVPANDGSTNYAEDLVINRFARHKINEKLINLRVSVVLGASCEVRQSPWFVDVEKFEITELMQTDDGVIEDGGVGGENIPRARIVATLSERKKFDASEITASAGKILVIGNADFMANGKINILGNRFFWFGIGDHMLSAERVGSFEDVSLKTYRLSLSRDEFRRVSGRISLLSLGFLLLGLFVAWRRRA